MPLDHGVRVVGHGTVLVSVLTAPCGMKLGHGVLAVVATGFKDVTTVGFVDLWPQSASRLFCRL